MFDTVCVVENDYSLKIISSAVPLCISDEKEAIVDTLGGGGGEVCFHCSVCRMIRCNSSKMNSLHLLDDCTFP